MIEGVKIINLKTHEDERGFFREVFRFPEAFQNIPVGQLSHSLVKKGIIKAWHGHKYQSQWNYVVKGKIKVVLYDNRSNYKTFGKFCEFFAGENENVAYYFPPGVFHGYECIEGSMHIIYITSGIYDINDEIRISQNDLSISYKWSR